MNVETMAVLVNLAQRARGARRAMRRAADHVGKHPKHRELLIAAMAANGEAWNSLQAAKAIVAALEVPHGQ